MTRLICGFLWWSCCWQAGGADTMIEVQHDGVISPMKETVIRKHKDNVANVATHATGAVAVGRPRRQNDDAHFLRSRSMLVANARVGVQRENKTEKQLRVAFVTFITAMGSPAFRDSLYVYAYGAKKAASKSRHLVELLALVPPEFPANLDHVLLDAGFKEVVRKPMPVDPSLVEKPLAKEAMAKVQGNHGGKAKGADMQFLMASETIKYWGMALTSYDRVLVIDADVMVLDPMDALMERGEDFLGTYDWGLDAPHSAMPPVQGGFLLFRPSLNDFEAVKNLTREGDFRSGTGWKGSGIGWCYGGVGPDGLLAYYFNKDAFVNVPKIGGKKKLPEGLSTASIEGSRMLAVDRTIYDVVQNNRLLGEIEVQGKDKEETIARVKSVHFTGNCIKPWGCHEPKDWFCKGLMDKWWQLRAAFEKERGLSASPEKCEHNKYTPLALAELPSST